jgi:hypothetical protein
VGKGNLKEKREKLKSDRFKPAKYQSSSTEERIVKRNLEKLENKAHAPKRQVDKPKSIGAFGGDLEDIWGDDGKVIGEVDNCKTFKKFKQGFAKKDRINVKQVINPQGGLSYNPS